MIIVDIDMPSSCSVCPIKGCAGFLEVCPIIGELAVDMKRMTLRHMPDKLLDPEKENQNVLIAEELLGINELKMSDSIDLLNSRTGSGTKVRAYNALINGTDIRKVEDFISHKVSISGIKSIKGMGEYTFNTLLMFLDEYHIVPDYENDVFVQMK